MPRRFSKRRCLVAPWSWAVFLRSERSLPGHRPEVHLPRPLSVGSVPWISRSACAPSRAWRWGDETKASCEVDLGLPMVTSSRSQIPLLGFCQSAHRRPIRIRDRRRSMRRSIRSLRSAGESLGGAPKPTATVHAPRPNAQPLHFKGQNFRCQRDQDPA